VVVQDIQQGLLSVEKNDVYKKKMVSMGLTGLHCSYLMFVFVTFGIGTSTNSALDID